MNTPAARHRNTGFTLIEILVVLAISGLLIALGTPVYLRYIATNEVRNAAVNVTQEVARVRTQVKRQDAPVTLTIADGSGTIVSDRTVTLPLVKFSGTLNLTFVPPYGTLASGTTTPQSVTVTSTRNAGVTRKISVVSLFGKTAVQ